MLSGVEVVQAVLSGILASGEPQQVFPFGSALTDRFTWASDIDLVVLFVDVETLRSGRQRILLNGPYSHISVDDLFGVVADFNARADVGDVYAVVKQSGKLIYDKRSAALARIRGAGSPFDWVSDYSLPAESKTAQVPSEKTRFILYTSSPFSLTLRRSVASGGRVT